MKTRKIGFILDDSLDKPDGVQQYVLAIGTWLTSQGHEVHYLVGESSRQDVEHLHSLSKNIHVRFNGNAMSIPLPTARKPLRKVLAEERFDVLHVQMPYSPWLAHRILMAAPASTVCIGTFHIMPHTAFAQLATRGLRVLLNRSIKRLDSVFAVSEVAKDFAESAFGLHDVTVMSNVVDVQRFKNAKPFEKYADDTPTVMFLGRLVPRKGCMVLLQAIDTILTQPELPPNFRVVICGKGPLDADLKAFVAARKLEEIITFTGFVSEEDKPRYIASADIMVFPSNGGESFGIVLIEAMAANHPLVLAGDNPGYRSVLDPKEELLFDAMDPEELARKICTYIENPERATALRAWQVEYVRQFDIATVGQKILTEYERVLRHKSNS